MTFDRRGHGQSERPPGQRSRRQDEDDLAALIATLGLAPANVAGNSFEASVTLGLAARHPELFRAVIAHEPPLFPVLAGDPELLSLLQEFQTVMNSSSAVSLSTQPSPSVSRPASGTIGARARDVRPYRNRTVAPFRPRPDRSNIIGKLAQAVPPAKWKGRRTPNTKDIKGVLSITVSASPTTQE